MASELPVDGGGEHAEEPPPRDAPVQDDAQDDAQVTYLSAKLRRLERWLLAELRHGRAERRLLEELVLIKEQDVEFHRQRLDSAQRHVMRLRSELADSRNDLLARQQLLNQAFVDNAKLRADNREIRSMLQVTHHDPYHSIRANDVFIQYTDTHF